MKISEHTIPEFVKVLASNAPVPGGGGAAALVGAVGTALGNMVGALTVGKKKYADVEGDIRKLMQEATALQQDLINLIDKDAEDFEPLAKAYTLPANTEQERDHKAKVMEECLKYACETPLTIMKRCERAIEVCAEFAQKGSRLAVSDAGSGVILCNAAMKAASLNVYINTKACADRAWAKKTSDEADALINRAEKRAAAVFNTVVSGLRSA